MISCLASSNCVCFLASLWLRVAILSSQSLFSLLLTYYKREVHKNIKIQKYILIRYITKIYFQYTVYSLIDKVLVLSIVFDGSFIHYQIKI